MIIVCCMTLFALVENDSLFAFHVDFCKRWCHNSIFGVALADEQHFDLESESETVTELSIRILIQCCASTGDNKKRQLNIK